MAAAVAQQWEYARLFLARNSPGPWVVNGKSLGLVVNTVVTEGVDVDTAVAQLGQEGWEMVGVAGSADSFHLFFKRHKSRGN
jgi:hypothetical protein